MISLKNVVFCFCFLFLQNAFAQQLYCPVAIDESNRTAHLNYQADLQSMGAQRDLGQTLYVPITLHSIGSKGAGFANGYDLFKSICALNDYFKAANIQFFPSGDIQFHDDESVYGFESRYYLEKLKAMTAAFNVPKTLNIYVTKITANEDGTYLCGAAPFPSWDDLYLNGKGGVLINSDCLEEGAKTITHEIGHHFDLLHTFETANGSELVTRNIGQRNCDVTGDGFCDTPADTRNYTCPYQSAGERDLHGVLYDPDWKNFMSYYGNNCLSEFSAEQYNHARMVLENDSKRNIYLDYPLPNNDAPASFSIVSPSNGSTLPVNEIALKWTSSENAKWYLVNVTISGGRSVFSTIVSENNVSFELPNSASGKQYRLSISAINELNMCSGAQEERTFSLGAPTTVYQNFIDGVSFKLIPNPSKVDGDIIVRFNAGSYSQGFVSLFDLYGKTVQSEAVNFMKGENNFPFSLKGLAKGIYFINIAAEGGSLTKKLVVD